MWDPFTLDALKVAFMAERETPTSVRGEQLKAREEAVRMRLIHKTLKPRRRIPSSGQLVVWIYYNILQCIPIHIYSFQREYCNKYLFPHVSNSIPIYFSVTLIVLNKHLSTTEEIAVLLYYKFDLVVLKSGFKIVETLGNAVEIKNEIESNHNENPKINARQKATFHQFDSLDCSIIVKSEIPFLSRWNLFEQW